MNRTALIVIAVSVGAITSVAFAQKPVVYPAKGQSAQQKQKDDRGPVSHGSEDLAGTCRVLYGLSRNPAGVVGQFGLDRQIEKESGYGVRRSGLDE